MTLNKKLRKQFFVSKESKSRVDSLFESISKEAVSFKVKVMNIDDVASKLKKAGISHAVTEDGDWYHIKANSDKSTIDKLVGTSVMFESLSKEALKAGDIVHTPGGVAKVVSVVGSKVNVRMVDGGVDQQYDLGKVQAESVHKEFKVGDKVKVTVADGNPSGVVKKIIGDVIEVEYTTKGGITRVDKYYDTNLKKESVHKESIKPKFGLGEIVTIDNKKCKINHMRSENGNKFVYQVSEVDKPTHGIANVPEDRIK